LRDPARRANTGSTRHLRLITPADAQATRETLMSQTGCEPELAIFRLERATTNQLLPSELARRVIAHYSDRGDLVLTSRRRVLAQALALRRRALALSTIHTRSTEATAAGSRLIALRPDERADLAVATLKTEASERRASSLAACLFPLLKPGAFLVIALERRQQGLGTIVRACQDTGLQYWQHVITLEPTLPPAGEPQQAKRTDAAAREGLRAVCCHRDLLVFRRPVPADALATEEVALEQAAA
jgi:hypothetical protein